MFPETLGLESRKVSGFLWSRSRSRSRSRSDSLGFRDFFTLCKMLPTRKNIVQNFNILTNFHRFRLRQQIRIFSSNYRRFAYLRSNFPFTLCYLLLVICLLLMIIGQEQTCVKRVRVRRSSSKSSRFLFEFEFKGGQMF